jgi:hypothetical protein
VVCEWCESIIFEEPGSAVCSLNVTVISLVTLRVQYSLDMGFIFLIDPGCCNDSLVGVISGLENGVDVCCKLET